ncbi:MAG: radical SAM protein [Betaproteobacteria bacterium]|nr:radical SAM protein [Betaproteobacteria bacterium]
MQTSSAGRAPEPTIRARTPSDCSEGRPVKLSETLRAPSWVVIQLLEHCNLRCRMCYEWGETGAYHARADSAMLELPLVLRTVRECLPTRPAFEFFGGEPLLYPGIWDVIALIREGGCGLAFPTNGMLLEEHAERLVTTAPTRLWVSLDGPEEVNDRQRGRGVHKRVLRGLEKLREVRRAKGGAFPQLGVTFVVTPANHEYVEEFFLGSFDLSMLSCVSIELQSYATAEQARAYAQVLATGFGVKSTPCADAYVRDPATFAGIDMERLTEQMKNVSRACAERGISFYSQPKTLEVGNIRSYFGADWDGMADRKSRCGVPWVCAEISARGDVTTCHTFYDLPIGNIHEQGLLEIWRGARLKQVQSHLRDRLFPICTACCRYYGGAGALGTPRAGES